MCVFTFSFLHAGYRTGGCATRYTCITDATTHLIALVQESLVQLHASWSVANAMPKGDRGRATVESQQPRTYP